MTQRFVRTALLTAGIAAVWCQAAGTASAYGPWDRTISYQN